MRHAAGRTEGYLTWGEFLDFFFLGGASLRERGDGNDWWNQLDSKGNYITKNKEGETENKEGEEEDKGVEDGAKEGSSPSGAGKRSPPRRAVKMTPSLQILQESRQERALREVEEEFARISADKKAKQGQPAPQAQKKVPEYDSLDTGLGADGFGF